MKTCTAYVAVAKLLDLQRSRLVEWQANSSASYYWSTWHGFAPSRMAITQEYLDGLGIDRKTITDDRALEAALANVQGATYEVRTSAWPGGINTFVEARATLSTSDAGATSPRRSSRATSSATRARHGDRVSGVQLPDADDVPF